MDRYQLAAQPRDMLGKVKVKRIRREGWIPAVIYGKGVEPTPLQVKQDDFNAMVKAVGSNVLVDLTVAGQEAPVSAMVKKLQRDALSLALLNIDFHAVSLTDVISNRVPVELVGEPRGVAEGGTLLQPLTEVEIQGLAVNLPASIQADISGLGLDESLHARDLVMPEGIELLTLPEEVVAVVHSPKAAAEEPVEPEEITSPDLAVQEKEE